MSEYENPISHLPPLQVSVNPAHIPLPPTRHGTVFTEAPERTFPGISVIDFARTVPLPESRAPTIIGTHGERDALKATVEVSLHH